MLFLPHPVVSPLPVLLVVILHLQLLQPELQTLIQLVKESLLQTRSMWSLWVKPSCCCCHLCFVDASFAEAAEVVSRGRCIHATESCFCFRVVQVAKMSI